MKKISIIIVTHNACVDINACVDSVLKQEFDDFELIIIDNASSDETRSILKYRFPNIPLIENRYNFGYGRALNQGIARANGEFILCLNDDIKLNVGFLTNIHEGIKSNAVIGAEQPKELRPNGKGIDTAGVRLSFCRRFHDIGGGNKDGAEFAKQKYIFGANGSAALYRREALETIRNKNEYFDEDFFCLVEDVDLSWRMQKKGWKILYYPEAVCTHERGISGKKDSFTQYLSMRNRYLVIFKNESFLGLSRYLIVFFIYDLWRNLCMLFINPINLFRGLYEAIILCPRMIEKRYAQNYLK